MIKIKTPDEVRASDKFDTPFLVLTLTFNLSSAIPPLDSEIVNTDVRFASNTEQQLQVRLKGTLLMLELRATSFLTSSALKDLELHGPPVSKLGSAYIVIFALKDGTKKETKLKGLSPRSNVELDM